MSPVSWVVPGTSEDPWICSTLLIGVLNRNWCLRSLLRIFVLSDFLVFLLLGKSISYILKNRCAYSSLLVSVWHWNFVDIQIRSVSQSHNRPFWAEIFNLLIQSVFPPSLKQNPVPSVSIPLCSASACPLSEHTHLSSPESILPFQFSSLF